MRINAGASQASRLAYYDRNPLEIAFIGSTFGVGPHSATTRVSYTVPANRKAIFTGLVGRYRRATAAAPVGIVNGQWGTSINTLQAFHGTLNAVDQTDGTVIGIQDIVAATGLCTWSDSDLGTGGTVDYFENGMITEFDA